MTLRSTRQSGTESSGACCFCNSFGLTPVGVWQKVFEVLDDVDGAIREPHDASIQAHSAWNRLVPEEGHRSTNENTGKERPDTPQGYDTDGDMASKSEARVWENGQVLHQDGQLGQGQGKVVDPDAPPKCLQRYSQR